MQAQISQGLGGGLDRAHWTVMSKIPYLDLSVATAADELSSTSSLQMYVGDPLLVVPPYFDHRLSWPIPLIVNPHRTIPETSHQDVARDLIRSQRGDAGARAGGDVLRRIRVSIL